MRGCDSLNWGLPPFSLPFSFPFSTPFLPSDVTPFPPPFFSYLPFPSLFRSPMNPALIHIILYIWLLLTQIGTSSPKFDQGSPEWVSMNDLK